MGGVTDKARPVHGQETAQPTHKGRPQHWYAGMGQKGTNHSINSQFVYNIHVSSLHVQSRTRMVSRFFHILKWCQFESQFFAEKSSFGFRVNGQNFL